MNKYNRNEPFDKMVDSVSTRVPRNIIYGLRRVLIAIQQNESCTNHMLQGVVQQLRRIYMLVVDSQSPTDDFENLMENLHRWVVQWSDRGHIDDEMRDLRPVFETTLDWWNQQDRDRSDIRSEYMNNIHLIYDQNPTVQQMIREAEQQQQP